MKSTEKESPFPRFDSLRVSVTSNQARLVVANRVIQQAVCKVLRSEGHLAAHISVAVVDDPTIHALNWKYLQHDYPTDVLSFLLSDSDEPLEGEIVVSADTAVARAPEFAKEPLAELLLYVIHGTLHLCGYDDHLPLDRQRMRALERRYFGELGCPLETE